MLFAKANNLLNENIRNSVSYLRNLSPEPGRGAEVGIRISFWYGVWGPTHTEKSYANVQLNSILGRNRVSEKNVAKENWS